MVKIIGSNVSLPRITTGLWSFDRAFSGLNTDIGYPLNSTNEVFGPTHCGKSTIVWSLACIIAKQLGTNIALADFEGFDVDFLVSVCDSLGFVGDLAILGDDTDEKRLSSLVAGIDKGFGIGIVDSVGAISPISEMEGDLGDANMGRRAKLMAQFSRKSTHALVNKKEPAAFFVINHVHPNLGFAGTSTPGGKTLEYLAGIRTKLKQVERFEDGSYRVVGEVVKNKYGRLGRKFNLVVLAGRGINHNLTNYVDAVEAGLFTAKNGVVRNLDGTKICRTKEVFPAAIANDTALFETFNTALFSSNNILPVEDATITDGENE